MNRKFLQNQIIEKKSVLCVGLDTDSQQLPEAFTKDVQGVLEFNKIVIEATRNHAVAYKINTAFYESLGHQGWRILEETVKCIPQNIFKIADAKRGDIGNTSKFYARAFFKTMNFDAVTLNPFLGSDVAMPFYEYPNKWVILLGITSNPEAEKIQFIKTERGNFLYEEVLEESQKWGNEYNTMFVVGATKSPYFTKIKRLLSNHFFLVPGIGAQGGSIQKLEKLYSKESPNLLVNISRDILFCDKSSYFRASIEAKAKSYKESLKILFS